MVLVRLAQVALVAVLSAQSTFGMVGGDAHEVATDRHFDGRKLVETEFGIALENYWIASTNPRNRVNLEKRLHKCVEEHPDMDGEARRRLARDLQKKEELMKRRAYVFFHGPKSVADCVGKAKGVDVEPDLIINSLAPPSWGLDRVDQKSLPMDGKKYSASHTGAGVFVYIVDTGILKSHVQFGSRAIYGGDFINEGKQADQNGHGTHCAGTALGSTYGIAPDATLVGVKVLSGGGSGSTSGVIGGVNWVRNDVKNRGLPSAVMSMSLGGGKSSAMDDAVKDASDDGLIVTVAAGNSNNDACTMSPAGAGGNGPAGGVITVSASTSSDSRASYSSYGSCTDMYAPGSSITSAWIGSNTAKNTISGTSMATPHVAGVMALLLEKHNGDKTAAVNEAFALTVSGKIKDAKGTPNLLLQVPLYTGPPTPPTVAPTMPPSHAPVTVCVNDWGACASEWHQSTFGPNIEEDEVIVGELYWEPSLMCEDPGTDMTDKIVLVERGECLFFTKVQNAEKNGALAVIIYMANSDSPFPPAYYGDEEVFIPSLMISRSDGLTFKGKQGTIATIGSKTVPTGPPVPRPTFAPTPPTRSPTNAPTGSPTQRPTRNCEGIRRKKGCARYDYCAWVAATRTCMNKENTPPPTPQPTAFTPPECHKGSLASAQTICDDLGMRLCTTQEILTLPGDSTCGFDTAPVWTSKTCKRGGRHKALIKRRRKGICVPEERTTVAVRCCQDP
jgi:hypothetical protein